LVGLPLFNRKAQCDHPYKEQGEGHKTEQECPGHGAMNSGMQLGVEYRRALVQGLPPQHGEVNDGDIDKGEDGHNRAAPCTDLRVGRNSSNGHVTKEEQEEERS
jgi:hypothetical protein